MLLPALTIVFSEGAERMVHKFRFLDDNSHSFIGPKMMAKESRFVEATTSCQHRKNYHRECMRTQAIAGWLSNSIRLSMPLPNTLGRGLYNL